MEKNTIQTLEKAKEQARKDAFMGVYNPPEGVLTPINIAYAEEYFLIKTNIYGNSTLTNSNR